MGISYEVNTTGSAAVISDKWRRTRGHNNENVAGSIKASDFTEFVVDGLVPSGVAVAAGEVSSDGAVNFKPWAKGEKLAGFVSDMTGVDVQRPGADGAVAVTVAIRETIVPKYLPNTTQREALVADVDGGTLETSGDFVFIKE